MASTVILIDVDAFRRHLDKGLRQDGDEGHDLVAALVVVLDAARDVANLRSSE